MFGEGASEDDCAWSLRVRCADGTERRADRLEQVGAIVEHAGSGAVFDYRLSKRASAHQNLPALTTGRTREAPPSDREIILDGSRHRVPVVDADAVGRGETGNGPCLIQSPYWSAVLPSGWKWKLTEYGFRLSR
jgi:N-methylhydantoinase A/oxoprolinase/acetone carboxylase beta subunit